jgi:uncharacterized protein
LEDIKKFPKQRRSTALNQLWKETQQDFKLTMHGPWHWEKVEKNALALAKVVEGADRKVCQLFTVLHDSQRETDSECDKHGEVAAKHVEKLFENGTLKISKKQKEKLVAACAGHNGGQTSDDPTIGVCWDADRLDLVRVGITPDLDLLSTDAAKTMIWKI